MTAPGEAPAVRALLESAAFAGRWRLDGARSTVLLQSRSMWGLAPVKGAFREVSGEGTVSAPGEVTGTVTVAAASVGTGNGKRDTHLRSADFFDAAAHPGIVFTASEIRPSGDGVRVSGNLTVRGRTRPISFPARIAVASDTEVSLDAEVQVDRSQFGLTWNQLGMASMKNTISVHAVFTKA